MERALELNNKTILVTGAAGFIGASLVARLLNDTSGCTVVGVDNLNCYYDVNLKQARLDWVSEIAQEKTSTWHFERETITDKDTVLRLFEEYRPDIVVHLAAQPGVRYSVDNPDSSIQNNVNGFYSILEACRHNPVSHLVYASSSSIYGERGHGDVFSIDSVTDSPRSLYAATKKSNELMAYAYSSLYGISTTGLRFFTVYGPFGRPDMFIYTTTQKLLSGETVELYGYGDCKRDFTHIDDIVEGVVHAMQCPPASRCGEASELEVPHALYNIGCGKSVPVRDVVEIIRDELVRIGALPADRDIRAQLKLLGMQPGDVSSTCADIGPLHRDFGFTPHIDIRQGIRSFVEWYVDYHNVALR